MKKIALICGLMCLPAVANAADTPADQKPGELEHAAWSTCLSEHIRVFATDPGWVASAAEAADKARRSCWKFERSYYLATYGTEDNPKSPAELLDYQFDTWAQYEITAAKMYVDLHKESQ